MEQISSSHPYESFGRHPCRSVYFNTFLLKISFVRIPNASTISEPSINNWCFTFTGKERDEETGYGYFGARYMDHELMTMWLSVDPMADKYPSISPYAYCAWNPVKLVDPDGREFGDYYAQNFWGTWKKIGSDNHDDGKVYVVPFKEDQKKVKNGDFNIEEKYELPTLEARNEICDYVEESDRKDNLREYGGTIWENGDNGKQDIRYSKPGARWYGGDVATVNQNDYEGDFDHVGKRLLLYFHSHFSGTINGIGLIQHPSDSRFDNLQGRSGDIQNVMTNGSRTGGARLPYNIMFAMKTKQVYFYTHGGVKFTMNFSDFRTLGGTK